MFFVCLKNEFVFFYFEFFCEKKKCSDTLNYCKSSTFSSSINFSLSHWMPNPNAEKKKKNAKVLPVSMFPAAMYFVLEIFALTFCTFLS